MMDRRTFLKTSAVAAAGFGFDRFAGAADPSFAPSPSHGWRVFEVTTHVEPTADGVTRAWVPLPSVEEADWIRPMGNLWQGNASIVQEWRDPIYGARMLAARWEAGESRPMLEVVSRFATRDRAIDLGQPGKVAPLDAATRRLYTRPTALLPTDGIVRKSALEITRGARTDLDKARAIYEWIVDNTQRNPKTRGCGLGDIRFMLETGDLSGKCADLNSLFVGLAHAVGLPARDVYGIRVADSRFGYQCLGKSGDISKAQHCRAEVWLTDFGWVPVDPADVRKVVLEEPPGNLSLADARVVAVRQKLFGAWEMNWLAYNFAHDLKLPGSAGAPIPFLMYPQGENAKGRLDSLDPAGFAYALSAKEITA
ncbi:transglutaminase-like domain-containing protein [Thiobacillus sedimenti]|uniref:Transglutaminase domain-containing protein n=1 Tax=Thiobacillus sedimenti TaxID=3110231 RepID=A0ABZ1CL72_9PROT|nr:transglutaminase domain-containing protein [Thiobacillus sp. SCUT-2]WRS40127.1 transglutaminase domain-containing protein [Thiobacillus sp. SCUT-2]